jgi:hypothetical protein
MPHMLECKEWNSRVFAWIITDIKIAKNPLVILFIIFKIV